jgi:hypothetical protein
VTARLGVWVGLPLLAFVVLLLAISALPGSDCDGSADGTAAAEVLVVVIACAASIGCAAGAVYRVGAHHFKGPGISVSQIVVAVAFGALFALLTEVIDLGENVRITARLFFAGVVNTGILLLVLLGALIARRRVDDVGLLLPMYLLGAAGFVYPSFALLALAVNSGAFC